MRMWVAVVLVLLLTSMCWGGSAEIAETSLTTFRITSAEIHLQIIAVNQRNQPVTELSTRDFELLRDGHSVQQVVSFERQHQAPLSALVLTDVSDSMTPGIALERQAGEWLRANSSTANDHVRFFDFGLDVRDSANGKGHNDYMTSLYDSAVQIIPRIAYDSGGVGRRAVILLSDGGDNSSLHSLEDVIRLAQKYDVAIYAITAKPNRKQNVAEDVLTAMTANTGGRFYQVRNAREMQAAIAEVSDELRNGYEIVLRADAEAGTHRLAIRSRSKLRFFYRTAYYQPEESREVASAE
jgi:Ca-activated chloride channel homolog